MVLSNILQYHDSIFELLKEMLWLANCLSLKVLQWKISGILFCLFCLFPLHLTGNMGHKCGSDSLQMGLNGVNSDI